MREKQLSESKSLRGIDVLSNPTLNSQKSIEQIVRPQFERLEIEFKQMLSALAPVIAVEKCRQSEEL